MEHYRPKGAARRSITDWIRPHHRSCWERIVFVVLILLVLAFTAAGVISCLILNGQLYGLDTCDTWNTGRLSTCNITQMESYTYTRDICNSQRYGQNNNVCHRITYNGIRYGVTWINDDHTTCAAQLVDQYSSTWSYSLTIGHTIPCCASSITCLPIYTHSNNNNNSSMSSSNMDVISDRPIVPTPYDHEWHLRVIADHTSLRLAYAGISFGIVFGMIPLAFILATRCHSLLCDDALPHMPTMSNLSPPPPSHQQYPQYVRAVRVLTPAPNRASMMYTISPGHVSNVSTGSNPMTSSSGSNGVLRRVTMDGIPVVGRERTGSTPSAGSGSNTPTRSSDGYHHRNGSNDGTPNSNGSSNHGRSGNGYRRGRHHSHGSMGSPGDFDFAVVEMEPRFNDDLAEDDEHPSP